MKNQDYMKGQRVVTFIFSVLSNWNRQRLDFLNKITLLCHGFSLFLLLELARERGIQNSKVFLTLNYNFIRMLPC
jgi:hypothetical protein